MLGGFGESPPDGLLSLGLLSFGLLSEDLLSEVGLSEVLPSEDGVFSSADFPVAKRGAPDGDRLSVEYQPEPLNTILTGE